MKLQLCPPPRDPAVDKEIPDKAYEDTDQIGNKYIHPDYLDEEDRNPVVDCSPPCRNYIKKSQTSPHAGYGSLGEVLNVQRSFQRKLFRIEITMAKNNAIYPDIPDIKSN